MIFFFHMLRMSSSQLTKSIILNFFQRGRAQNHQQFLWLEIILLVTQPKHVQSPPIAKSPAQALARSPGFSSDRLTTGPGRRANLLPAPVAKAVQAKEVAQQGLRVSSFSHLNGKHIFHMQKYMDFCRNKHAAAEHYAR